MQTSTASAFPALEPVDARIQPGGAGWQQIVALTPANQLEPDRVLERAQELRDWEGAAQARQVASRALTADAAPAGAANPNDGLGWR